MLFLRNKDQRQKNSLLRLATRSSEHELIASSSLHDTRTVNLAFMQYERHTGE